MQSVSSRIWTRITMSISYDDNHYTIKLVWLIVFLLLSELSDKIYKEFSQALATTWTLIGGKNLDRNYTRMLHTVWNKSWKQHLTKQQLYGHLLPISQTIKVRQARHSGNCWSKVELMWCFLMDSYTWTYQCWPTIHLLCMNTGCHLEDNDKWQEKVNGLLAFGMPWRWWSCTKTKEPRLSYYLPIPGELGEENRLIHAFLVKLNANSLDWDLNSACRVYFQCQ